MNVKRHKWIVFLLIASLFAGMWNGSVVKGEETETRGRTVKEAVSDASVKKITEIEINGVERPKTSEKEPSKEGIKVEKVIVESGSVESPAVETGEVDTRAAVESPDIEWMLNKDEMKYTLSITLTSKNGYEFSQESGKLQVTIKDEMGEKCEPINVDYVGESRNKITITCDFALQKPTSPPTSTPSEIEKVIIGNITIPEGGGTFSTIEPKIEAGQVTIGTVTWEDVNGKTVEPGTNVAYNTKYGLCIQLKKESGYKFPEDLEGLTVGVKIGDKIIECTDKGKTGDEGIIVIYYTFVTGEAPATESPETPTPGTPTPGTPTPETPTPEIPSPTPPVVTNPPETPSPTPPLITSTPNVQPTITPTSSPVPTYTIILDANGGALSQTTITFTADEMSKLKLPEPTKKGYIFIGWYAGKNRVDQIKEAKNIQLKAQWVKTTINMTYLSTIKLVNKLELSSDVKLEKVVIKEKKYKKYVTVNQKKMTMKGKKKKYFKKATAVVTIDGEEFEVTVKMVLPKPKIKKPKDRGITSYVVGVYRRYSLSYTYLDGATGVKAEYSTKRKKGYKPCVRAQNKLKGASISVKKGTVLYLRITVYYGKKNASPKSKEIRLKG